MVTTTNRGQWISREARAMACRRAASGHRGAALRALMPPLTILLLVVTVVALLVTAVSLAPLIPPAPPAAAANADLARRFYAAANAILADADPALLAALVAPGFADHEPGGSTLDRAGLTIRLGGIARAVPGVQLKVGTIVADGDWIAVQVTATGGDRLATGGAVGDTTPAATTERLQLAGDRIIGYWPGATLADLPQALPPLPLGIWTAPTPVTLARIIYAPGASFGDLVAPGPQLLLLETGRLAVQLAGAASWFVVAHPELGWRPTLPTGQELTLTAGDVLFVPANVEQTQRNLDENPAAALSLAMFPPSVPATGRITAPAAAAAQAAASLASAAPPADAPPAVAMYNPVRRGAWTTWPSGVAVDVLARGFKEIDDNHCLGAPIALTVTRFALAPGAALPAHSVAGVALLAKEDVWLAGDAPSAGGSAPDLNGASLVAEQGLGSVAGRLGAVRNLGPQPLALTLYAVAPAASAACLPSSG